MTPTEMLELLRRWRAAGWLRALDLAFASFVHELDREAPASLVLGAALLVQLEGRGHSCLPIAALTADPLEVLGWPAPAAPELVRALADWPVDAAAARAAWGGREVLQIDPEDATGSSPLVWVDGRLYLRRYWRHETRVAAQVRLRAMPDPASLDGLAHLDPSTARSLLARLFAPDHASTMAADGPAEPDWQQVACALALRGRLTLITGGPGTGKTYTAARLLVLLQALHAAPQPLRVALAAPTGKAAARLRQSIDIALQELRPLLGTTLALDAWAAQLGPARTLHALLGARPGTRRFAHDAAHPLAVDVLFVDEASMVHLEMMAALLVALPSSARLILLGDKDQLASVEAGAVMGDLCQAITPDDATPGYRDDTAHWVRELTGQVLPATCIAAGSDLAQQTIRLRRSRRFAGPIGQLAAAVNRGDGKAALALLREADAKTVALIEARDAAAIPTLAVEGRVGAAGGYRAYLETLAARPLEASGFDAWARAVLGQFDRFRVLCALREGPWGVVGLNAAIERELVRLGLLRRAGEWFEGRPVMVTRNEAALGVFNGDVGVVLRAPGGTLRAYFLDGSELRSVSVGRLADVETAFAMTVHKSQGSEFEHVVLVLPSEETPVLTRELVYTGITRARSAFTLVAGDTQQLRLAIRRLTRRLSGLKAWLDS